MKKKIIGFDLSPLQGPHAMRGIGHVARNIMKSLPEEIFKNRLIFYVETKKGADDLLEELFSKKINDYETIELKSRPLHLSTINRLIWKIKNVYMGNSQFEKIEQLDSLVIFDQNQTPPRAKALTVLFGHDCIPYVIDWEYILAYRYARKRGYRRKDALRSHINRTLYKFRLRKAAKNSNLLFVNSEKTKQDFNKLIGIPANKMEVISFGIELDSVANAPYRHYWQTDWGAVELPFDSKDLDEYMLFVGGVDPRRRLQDVVAAYNMLRAQNSNIKLVLAGDILSDWKNLPDGESRDALQSSSYQEGIIYLGYVSESEKRWLYEHALCLYFPSVYEGFGLPVVEALVAGCPVIAYPNDATLEVASDSVSFARSPIEIVAETKKLLSAAEHGTEDYSQNKDLKRCFNWEKAARQLVDVLSRGQLILK